MTNHEIIAARLEADSILTGSFDVDHYTGIARGGIWTRKLKRNGDGDTPWAFYTSQKGRKIRPSIVVLDDGDSPHPQRDSIPTAYNQVVRIYFYAPATESGKQAIEDMRARVYALIDHEASGGWVFTSAEGPVVFPRYIDRLGRRDSEVFIEAVEDYQRFVLTSRYANVV